VFRDRAGGLVDYLGLADQLKYALAIALVAGLVWNPTSANCAQIRIEIRPTVSLVDDPDNLLNNRVPPGDIITGIYTYNSFARRGLLQETESFGR
jgi:hypothetical protein